MDNFDIKNFLTENKLTKASIINETHLKVGDSVHVKQDATNLVDTSFKGKMGLIVGVNKDSYSVRFPGGRTLVIADDDVQKAPEDIDETEATVEEVPAEEEMNKDSVVRKALRLYASSIGVHGEEEQDKIINAMIGKTFDLGPVPFMNTKQNALFQAVNYPPEELEKDLYAKTDKSVVKRYDGDEFVTKFIVDGDDTLTVKFHG